ncbi:MAG TPA: hypothetical protein VIJ94_20625, partial [Caulobacteraceae bacterium]
VLVSGDVKRAIRGPLGDRLKPQGSVKLDKMSETLPVFALAPAEGGRPKGRRLDVKAPLAGIVALAFFALVGFVLWPGHGLVPALGAEPSRVAILPFQTLTAGADVHAFADGLADQLQTVLSNNGTQTVSSEMARTLRGVGEDELVRALGVRLIVEGAAQSDGKTINVSVHVDDPSHHLTLWTAELKGPATNPSALQAQVGARIISVLNCSASALRPKGGLSDPETLGLQLKACDLLETQSLGDDAQAVFAMLDAFRQVSARAPGFAPGHSALATYLGYYRVYLPPELMPQLGAEAYREAHKALAIDPNDPKAFIALGMLTAPGDFLKRDQLFSHSFSLDPNGIYPNMFEGGSSMMVGRLADALTHTQRAVAANPMSLEQTSDVLLAWNGQTRAAEEELARLRRLWPKATELWADRIAVYTVSRNWPELKATLRDTSRPKTLSDAGFSRLQLAIDAASTRSPGAMAKAHRALMDAAYVDPTDLTDRIKYLAWLGFVDDAFAMADRFARLSPAPAADVTFLFSPLTSGLRRDPRFMTLAARLGLASYWSRSGKWPDFCFEPDLPYDCKALAAKLTVHPPG